MRYAGVVVALVVAECGALSVAHHVGRVGLAQNLVVATSVARSARAAVLLVAAVQAAQRSRTVADPSKIIHTVYIHTRWCQFLYSAAVK